MVAPNFKMGDVTLTMLIFGGLWPTVCISLEESGLIHFKDTKDPVHKNRSYLAQLRSLMFVDSDAIDRSYASSCSTSIVSV